MDVTSCFLDVRLGPKTSVYEKHVSVKSTGTGSDVNNCAKTLPGFNKHFQLELSLTHRESSRSVSLVVVFWKNVRRAQSCTFEGPGTKIPREDPQREKKNENGSGRGKNKREISGGPAQEVWCWGSGGAVRKHRHTHTRRHHIGQQWIGQKWHWPKMAKPLPTNLGPKMDGPKSVSLTQLYKF